MIQEEVDITVDCTGALLLDKRVLACNETFGNYVEVTRVARHERPPSRAAVLLRLSLIHI